MKLYVVAYTGNRSGNDLVTIDTLGAVHRGQQFVMNSDDAETYLREDPAGDGTTKSDFELVGEWDGTQDEADEQNVKWAKPSWDRINAERPADALAHSIDPRGLTAEEDARQQEEAAAETRKPKNPLLVALAAQREAADRLQEPEEKAPAAAGDEKPAPAGPSSKAAPKSTADSGATGG
jgi:hypothetical protein